MTLNNSMDNEENEGADLIESRWCIDLDWYEQSNRSFLTLAQGSLCDNCAKKLEGEKVSIPKLLSAVKKCCSKDPAFINRRLSVLESVFRLFLANGNQPLSLRELGEQLREHRSGDTYATWPEILYRLLSSDQYYGLKQAED